MALGQVLDWRPTFSGSPSSIFILITDASQLIRCAAMSAIGPAPSIHGRLAGRSFEFFCVKQLSGKPQITEGMLNHVEVAIRAYDPCLSCATHALGQMPLQIELVDPDGAILDKRTRSG